jgi:hypothetical protein
MKANATVPALVLALTAARAAGAQTSHGPALGFGVGAAYAVIHVAGSDSSATGPTVHAAFGAFEVEYQPFAVYNPVRAEQFTALSLFVGPRIRLGGQAYLRPALGLRYFRWSGPDPTEPTSWGGAVGLLAERDFAVSPHWRLTPQLALRAAMIEFEGNVSTYSIALRAQIAHSR